MMKRRTKIALERMDGNEEMLFRVESKRWMKARVTELRVTAWGLEASGDLGGYKRGTLRLPWERVAELHYGTAGRGAIDGLYAREGEWCSRCVLPWVSEAQAEDVIAAIGKRYPRLMRNPESALEVAVGEALAQHTLIPRRWLPTFGRRGVPVSAPAGRI